MTNKENREIKDSFSEKMSECPPLHEGRHRHMGGNLSATEKPYSFSGFPYSLPKGCPINNIL